MTDFVLTSVDASKSPQINIFKNLFSGKLANQNIRQITDLLDVPALCALRKTSSFLASRTKPCFRNCFVVKHTSTTAISTTNVKHLLNPNTPRFLRHWSYIWSSLVSSRTSTPFETWNKIFKILLSPPWKKCTFVSADSPPLLRIEKSTIWHGYFQASFMHWLLILISISISNLRYPTIQWSNPDPAPSSVARHSQDWVERWFKTRWTNSAYISTQTPT